VRVQAKEGEENERERLSCRWRDARGREVEKKG